MMRKSRALLLLALSSACSRPSEERAVRDLDVGQATSATLDVHVDSGLATLRRFENERLALWSSAPAFELELVVRTPQSLTLEVENCMPNAELTDLGTELSVEEEATDNPTKKRWQLRLSAGTLRFRLATPSAATRSAFRFALLSDVQEAIDEVQDIFRLIDAEPDLDFLFGAGDLTERGTDEELARFQAELAALSVPYYTTLGNHEIVERSSPYHDWFGRGNFQFSHRGVYFTLLDSASATLDPLVYDWLDAWLRTARNSVHVLAMHIPPLDPAGVRNGAFGSRAEASALVGKLAEAGVDLTLYGHIHSYYSFDNAGIPAFISGGGGAVPERFDNIGRHFMVFDIDPDLGVTASRVVRVD
jgi:Icc-related predicted phosphoesterase